MTKKVTDKAPKKPMKPRRRKSSEPDPEEERLYLAATMHLIRHVGMFLVATGLREEVVDGAKRWIFEVSLRYPTGHDGFVGEMLYDGTTFTILTDRAVWKERIRQIAEDPERKRKWDEFQAAANLQAGKRQHVRSGLSTNGTGHARPRRRRGKSGNASKDGG